MARRERNIYKRKDGRYEARFIKSRDESGKAVYGTVYARSYAEVKEKLVQAKSINRMMKCSKKATIASELELYLKSIKNRIKPSTYGIYQGYIERYIALYFGDTHCDRLTTEIMQGFVNRLIDNGLSAVTVQSVFCFLKNGLKNTFTQDLFDVVLPKKIKNDVEVLSVDEQKRLETAARASDNIDYIAVMLCLYMGLRIGEVCGLLWSSIDFERRLLHVRRTVQRIKNSDYNGESKTAPKTIITCLTPKSTASLRSIPLPEFLVFLLSDYRKQARSDDEYVISRNDMFIEPRNLQYRFQNLLLAANVKQVNFHATRHTFAVRALENGFDIKTLSEILGHSSATVTLQKYAHTLDEHKRRSMESLAVVYH
jgi:integrase